MKQCEHCQFGNPEEARFCRHCGNPFPGVQPVAVQQSDSEPVDEEAVVASAAADEPAAPTEGIDAVSGEADGDASTTDQTQQNEPEPTAAAAATDEPVEANAAETIAVEAVTPTEDPDATVAIEQPVREAQPVTSIMPQQLAPAAEAQTMPQQTAVFQQVNPQVSQAETQPLPQQPGQFVQSAQPAVPSAMPAGGQPYAQQYSHQPSAAQPAQPGQTMPAQPAYQQQYNQQYQGAPAAPQQPSAFEAESRTFFNWLKEAFLHPSQDKPMKKWYSWVVTAFLTFMISANITLWVAQGASFADSLIGSTRYYRSALPSVLVVMWIALFLMLYAYILFALLGRRVLGDSKKFANFHDEYARRLMPWVVLELVVFVLSLIRLDVLAVPLQMLGLGLFSMWQPVVVAQGNSTAKRDPHWGWILAMIVQMLLTLLAIVLIVVVILGGFAASLAKMSYGMY